ncbi:MAG: hypothetical protein ACI9W2_000031, partial [Gammaproteobacteria bacterium]
NAPPALYSFADQYGADMTALERLQALQLGYVDTIDNGHVEGWPEIFTDQCHYLGYPST